MLAPVLVGVLAPLGLDPVQLLVELREPLCSRRCLSDRRVPNLRMAKPHRIATPAATPRRNSVTRADLDAEELDAPPVTRR